MILAENKNLINFGEWFFGCDMCVRNIKNLLQINVFSVGAVETTERSLCLRV